MAFTTFTVWCCAILGVRGSEPDTGKNTITNSIGMRLVLIPVWQFMMESPDSDGAAEQAIRVYLRFGWIGNGESRPVCQEKAEPRGGKLNTVQSPIVFLESTDYEDAGRNSLQRDFIGWRCGDHGVYRGRYFHISLDN